MYRVDCKFLRGSIPQRTNIDVAHVNRFWVFFFRSFQKVWLRLSPRYSFVTLNLLILSSTRSHLCVVHSVYIEKWFFVDILMDRILMDSIVRLTIERCIHSVFVWRIAGGLKLVLEFIVCYFVFHFYTEAKIDDRSVLFHLWMQ